MASVASVQLLRNSTTPRLPGGMPVWASIACRQAAMRSASLRTGIATTARTAAAASGGGRDAASASRSRAPRTAAAERGNGEQEGRRREERGRERAAGRRERERGEIRFRGVSEKMHYEGFLQKQQHSRFLLLCVEINFNLRIYLKNIRTRLAYDPDDLDFVVFLGKLEDYFVKYPERSADRHASILSRGARREQQTVVGFNNSDVHGYVCIVILHIEKYVRILMLDVKKSLHIYPQPPASSSQAKKSMHILILLSREYVHIPLLKIICIFNICQET